MLFFFKQKTAYEMRISDWSSDVCSSDLIGVMACISIVDDAGDLKAFLRMDGAAKLALDISQNKAFTAVSFGMSTDQWWEFIKDDAPLLHGITHTPRLTVFGGGRSEENTSELQSLMRLSYAVFCLKKKKLH